MALIVIFPIVSVIAGLKNKYVSIFICFMYCTVYYGMIGVQSIIHFPNSLLRCVAGLMLGMLIYYLTDLFSDRIFRHRRCILNVICAATFAIAIIFAMKNLEAYRFILLCFVINLALALSGAAFGSVKSKVLEFLGKLSMPLYIFHYVVGTMIELFGKKLGYGMRIAIYYLGSLLVSVVIYMVIDRIRPFDGFINESLGTVLTDSSIK